MPAQLRRWVAVGAVALGAVAAVPVALANGGGTIATAVPLPIGVPVIGGGVLPPASKPVGGQYVYQEYYKVDFLAGDRMTIDWESLNGGEVRLCLWSPDVTDFNIPRLVPFSSECSAAGETTSKEQLTTVVPSAGAWTLYVHQNCNGCSGPASVDTSYSLVATVQHQTKLVVSVPKLVAVGKQFQVRGKIVGVSGQNVEIKLTGAGTSPRSIAVPIGSGGSFVFSTRVTKAGKYAVSANFLGDETHLPSGGKASFKALPSR